MTAALNGHDAAFGSAGPEAALGSAGRDAARGSAGPGAALGSAGRDAACASAGPDVESAAGSGPAGLDAASAGSASAGRNAASVAGRASGGRPGLTAAASITADVDGGRPRIRWTHAWPVILRPTGDAQVHLVHGAGGPLGGDVLALDVQVGTGATLALRSAGATLVQPGREAAPARWDTTVRVGAGGALDWAPEPTVVTDGASFATSLRIDLAERGRARVREVVVLGRHGRAGGRYRGHLAVTLDGDPLLVHTTLLDGADAALAGLGGVAGARAVGSLLVTDGGGTGAGERPGVRWAWTDLAAKASLLLAVGDPGPVLATLAAPP